MYLTTALAKSSIPPHQTGEPGCVLGSQLGIFPAQQDGPPVMLLPLFVMSPTSSAVGVSLRKGLIQLPLTRYILVFLQPLGMHP